jgi:hypothetical protein
MSVDATVCVHTSWYPQSAIDDAISRFVSFCQVESTPSGETVKLLFRFLPGAPPETLNEFLNIALLSAIESFASQS